MVESPKIFLWLSTSYFTGGFDLNGDIIISAPPIARWAIGKKYDYVVKYYHEKNKLLDWKLCEVEEI